MADDGPMKWRARLSRPGRGQHPDQHEEWLATAGKYARHLTEAGSRCHLNERSTGFCHWEGTVLGPSTPAEESASRSVSQDQAASSDESVPAVGVRCTIHRGGRYLDSNTRLRPNDFA